MLTNKGDCISINLKKATKNTLTRHTNTLINLSNFTGENAYHSPQPGTPAIHPVSIGISYLDKTIAKLIEFLKSPKKFLRKLQFINKKRGKRKERIGAIFTVCTYLMRYLELSTLKIGCFNDHGSFISLCDIKDIAAKTGMAYIRVRRALKDLVLAGYLLVEKQVIRKEDGSYVGITSIKKFSTSFFTDLTQSYQKLKYFMDWKQKRLEKKIAKAQKKKGSSFLSSLIKPLIKRKSKDMIKTNKLNPDKTKALTAEALRIHALEPERSLTEIYRELSKTLE